MKKYAIGIDPGTHTGLAIYTKDTGQFVELITTDFTGAIDKCLEYKENVGKVYVEVPTTKHNWHDSSAAHNVGRVCREAELMQSMLEYFGFEVVPVKPGGFYKISTHEKFTSLTRYKGRTNQHKRDAAMLCWGS